MRLLDGVLAGGLVVGDVVGALVVVPLGEGEAVLFAVTSAAPRAGS